MSQHTIPTRDPAHAAVVGWNPALETYFGRVLLEEGRSGADEDWGLVWVGTGFREIRTADELAALMAPYAAIPPEVASRLRADSEERRYGPVPQRVAPLG